MEIGDISKVASRKRMKVEAEKLREKISRETAKIIKLKVAQDTAYWDLKEKLQQVEGNHERLQQNMVEVQMQHETISGQYQEELRLRPDTLNKLSSTRKICDVLEDYSERLKNTLSRCKADQAALGEAYQKSGQLVRDIKNKHLQVDEMNCQTISGLEDKVKMMGEHHTQLLQLFTDYKHQAETEKTDLKSKLETAYNHKEDLTVKVNDLNRKLDLCNLNIEKKEEQISNLQRDTKRLLHEFNAQSSEAQKTFSNQANDLKKAQEVNSSLKETLNEKEQFNQNLCEENNGLRKKLQEMAEEQLNTSVVVDELKDKLEKASAMYEMQKTDNKTLIELKERLIKEISEKEQIIARQKDEIQKLNQQLAEENNEKLGMKLDFDQIIAESNNKSSQIGELTVNMQNLMKNIEEMEKDQKICKESAEEKIKELTAFIETRDKELDSKASTIAQLMSDLKTSTDVRSKLETTLQKVKKEIDVERDDAKEKERKLNGKIDQLEALVKDKDIELSKQMSVIMEMRNEKERDWEKIQGMKNKIDNIQKELTGRPVPPEPLLMPELDDNAVMLTPGHEPKSQPPKSPIIQKSQFAVPRNQSDPKRDAMLYSLFSDSSMEGDALDAAEVNRRFAALSRGERISPVPLAALKRRCGVPAQPAYKLKPPSQGSISLSQVNDNITNKKRCFFKNKRTEKKTK